MTNDNAATPTRTTETEAYEAIRTAQMAVDAPEVRNCMLSSAELALADARYNFQRKEYMFARLRALDSLAYTCGKFSATYTRLMASKNPTRGMERI